MSSDRRQGTHSDGNVGAVIDPSTAAKGAFLQLEERRAALMTGLRRPWQHETPIEALGRHIAHPKPSSASPVLPSRRARLYERRCLGIEVTRVVEERLSRALSDQRRGPEIDWAEPWGHRAVWQYESDLQLLNADRRRLGRWLGPRTKARAEARAREQLERIVSEVDEDERRELARAAAVKRYGRFAGGRFADRGADEGGRANGDGDGPAETSRPAGAPQRPAGDPAVPTRVLRTAIGGVLAVALIASVALLASALRSDGEQTGSPTPSFLGVHKDSGSVSLPRVAGPAEAAAAAERRAERRRERRREQAREAEERAKAAARAKAAEESASQTPTAPTTEAQAPQPESAEPEPAAAAAAPEPAPAPTTTPAPAAPAPESSPAPTGGSGGASECFTFEC